MMFCMYKIIASGSMTVIYSKGILILKTEVNSNAGPSLKFRDVAHC